MITIGDLMNVISEAIDWPGGGITKRESLAIAKAIRSILCLQEHAYPLKKIISKGTDTEPEYVYHDECLHCGTHKQEAE